MKTSIAVCHTGLLWRAQLTIDSHTYIALMSRSQAAAVQVCVIMFIAEHWKKVGVQLDYDIEPCEAGRYLVVFFPKEVSTH